jgi:hypothetical protein
VTPEEQQIVTGAVLVLTLIIFGASGLIRKTRVMLSRFRSTGFAGRGGPGAVAIAPERQRLTRQSSVRKVLQIAEGGAVMAGW